NQAGLEMVHIPYANSAETVQALVSGETDVLPTTVFSSLEYAKAGSLVPLAIVGNKRAEQYPDVPTFEEAGISGVRGDTWYGLFAPAGTPDAVVEKLHAAVTDALETEQFSKFLEDRGQIIVGDDGETFQKFIESEVAAFLDLREKGLLGPQN